MSARVPMEPRTVASNERGIALAIALLALVVIGGLVSASFYVGKSEMTAGRNTVYSNQAAEMAESGLTDVFENWNPAWNRMLAGTPVSLGTTSPWGGVQYSETVTRVGYNVFMVQALGERVGPTGAVLASRLLGRLARLYVLDLDIQAAITANAQVTVKGTASKVDGHDYIPTGWGGCTTDAGVYGIRTSADVTTSGNPTIDGVPDKSHEHDATVVDSIFKNPYDELVPAATITIPGSATWNGMNPTTSGTPATCHKAESHNWGEPLRGVGSISECYDYYPIIHAQGDFKISTGRGQGILLVDGNLEIAGNVEFDGIILALGAVTTTGTGNKITGAVLSASADIGDEDVFAGNPTVVYSSCAISMVLNQTAYGVPLARRSWVQRWQ
jgi:hypothetical protein